jgi:hypothetical protein
MPLAGDKQHVDDGSLDGDKRRSKARPLLSGSVVQPQVNLT